MDNIVQDHGLTELEISRIKRERYFCMDEAHAHKEYEIYYVLSGQCRMFAGHQLFVLGPGDMMIFPSGCVHRTMYRDAEVTERWSIVFKESVLEPLKQLVGEEYLDIVWQKMQIPLAVSERGRLEAFFYDMEEMMKLDDEVCRLLARNRLLEVLVLARRKLLGYQNVKQEKKEKGKAETEALMQQAARYICSHYDQPLTLEELASRVHMTPTYFSRKFKEITDFRLKEYITYVRILEAEKRLINTEDSITEIAVQCGFSDGNYFGDVFSKIKGSSPREYRKKHSRKTI